MTGGRIYPVTFVWKPVDVVAPDGEVTRVKAMVPLPRYANLVARQYGDDEEYTLVPLEARSRKSHNHYHACIADGFANLPEKIAARWPSETHLRKWLLVETNWFDEEDFDCPDEQFARRLAAFVRKGDEYARISIHRPENKSGRWRVIVRRAKSQSAAMGKEAFQASKTAVLDLLEQLTNVPRGTLMKEAGKHA